MGFLFYASFVRFVLEGAYTHVLMERARVWIKAAGMVPPRWNEPDAAGFSTQLTDE
jgi:hypothetical protein